MRANAVDDYAPKNFNGAYVFQGTTNLSSLDQYRMTLALLQDGYTSRQVSAMGYGPSQYKVSTGTLYLGVSQVDYGPFAQDDWRVRPNLTLSLGLRWEGQTNISDKNDWAPRFGFAWSPGRWSGGRPKTVVRGGWSMFYDRFPVSDVLTAYRYNGANQLNYVLYNPTTFDSSFSIALPLSALTLTNSQQRYQIDSQLHAPALMQTVVSLERQLFGMPGMVLGFWN